MRDGNFMMSRRDVDWQLIPTAWVDAAIARWDRMKVENAGVPMCSLGVDVCEAGGNDQAVVAKRYDGWFDKLVVKSGKELQTEDDITALIMKHWRDEADIIIDMSGGYGTHTFEQLKSNKIFAHKYKGKKSTDMRAKAGSFGFPNTRSAAYWILREALDPSQPGGSQIALPNDMELRSELIALTYEPTTQGFKVEPKDSVKQKLGRSPDKADAVVMAWWRGKKGIAPNHPAGIASRAYGNGGKSSGIKVVTKRPGGKRTSRGR
jgi:hypothetical protein